ncbi:MAG TPA: acyltransferase family protein [Galbitalea sp.]|nr:acyltransferase family protein [Galbitalea sp.]
MRNDIQALRAVAVLMVIANHLFPDRFGGGYVGVDVFFVISGYLISGHLLREADGTGGVRLGAFWARRARRLLPAALLVLALCAIVVVIRAPFAVWQQNFAQIAVAAVYGLNWRLAFQSLNYFDQGNAQTLVTHYWSLSVEEQFYLVWPLIVLAVYFFARRQPLARRRLIVGCGFGVILLASFAWATYSTATTPAAAYFETTGRAWEFAAGGLLAMLPSVSQQWRTRLIPLVWAAWLVLVAGVVVINSTWGVPGPAALIPVAATGIVLAVGESERRFGTRYVTGLWPVRTIGDVSYSAYLWHWPLIVALPWFLGSDLTVVDKIAIAGATLVIAWLSKRFIEDPVRRGRPSKWRPSRAILAALAAMVIVFGGSGVSAYAVQREGVVGGAQIASEVKTLPKCFGLQASISGATCPDSHVISPRSALLLDGIWNFQNAGETGCVSIDNVDTEGGLCSFGVPEGTQKLSIALVGDSHAYMWSAALAAIAKRYSARIYLYAKGSCSPSADLSTQFVGETKALAESCNLWRTRTIDRLVTDKKIGLIVTSSRALSYLTNDGTGATDSGKGYAVAWNRWLASGKPVIAIADTPSYRESPEQCISTNDGAADPCASPLSVVQEPNPLSAAAASISNPRFAYANYSDLFCDTICHSVVGGLPVTRDGQHLTSFIVQSFGDTFLQKQIAQVLATPPAK